jgi:hypothetical protein
VEGEVSRKTRETSKITPFFEKHGYSAVPGGVELRVLPLPRASLRIGIPGRLHCILKPLHHQEAIYGAVGYALLDKSLLHNLDVCVKGS